MNRTDIHTATARARSVIHGEYVSTSRAIDVLLDLRALAEGDIDLLALIDRTLASLPNRYAIANAWWLESLDAIDQLADHPSSEQAALLA